MKNRSKSICLKRITTFPILFVLIMAFACPIMTYAKNTQKTVRVGWYESPLNAVDELGRRSGYAYEYQQKIAAYTGWTYEYVNGSWSELMEMLEAGKIDLLSDVSYTEDRAKKVLFSTIPMGDEEYYIFVAPDNTEISKNDYSTLDGKTVGVNKASVQADLYKSWAAAHDVKTNLVDLTSNYEDSVRMLTEGELDAYISLDAYSAFSDAVPLFKIGSSDFYFSVSKNRPDILSELDTAMNKIQDENRYYGQQLIEKYAGTSSSNLYLNSEEDAWLSSHGTIRIGYQDNHMAFCAADKDSGQITGALKDYLEYAADCIKNTHLEFEAIAYPTVSDAMTAMKNGEIDCMFPANFTDHDAEAQDIVITSPIISTEIYAIIRFSDQKAFARKENVTVAVNDGNPNYNAFLLDNFPGWKAAYFPDTSECLRAVATGKADCILISNYRYNNIAKLCEKYRLINFTTGASMSYSFATEKGNTELYSILAKITNVVPDSTIHAALSYYSAEDAKKTFADFVMDNLPISIAFILILALAFLALLILSYRAEKKAVSEQRLISATETDNLTGLYNRDFFFEYANQMYAEHPEKPMDAIVLDIEQFHSLTEINGHDFGEQTLRGLSKDILEFSQKTGGIAGRFETDQFDIYCQHLDDYDAVYDRFQNTLDNLTSHSGIKLRMGVTPWQKTLEPIKMLDSARIACNMARNHYNRHLVVFNEKVHEREVFRQHLLNDLHHAVKNKEFEVYYQPQYDIQTELPRLSGSEALVRWNHPVFGVIMPSDFIPILEKEGQISILDKYVWTESIKQVAEWRKKYGITVPVSINLSRVDFFDTAIISTLNNLLAENGLDCSAVNLEVTESAYADNENQVMQVLEELKKNGYNIEMDDFGAGYSSLGMLSSMPIDMLKMDSSFIKHVETDEKSVKLVELIIDIAKNLKVPVIAEGVETEYQLQLLKKLGCSFVQGYYFSRPLPIQEFETMIVKKCADKADIKEI